ncbi:MAG: AccI family restriction endonuclease [Bacteroidia bacterium]
MKELDRGRLLFHVTFEGGKASLNLQNFYSILGISFS